MLETFSRRYIFFNKNMYIVIAQQESKAVLDDSQLICWIRTLLLTTQVLDADQNAVSDIAPYMKSPALRAVIRSFTNDEEGNFGRWASNPHVLQMLKKAKWMLDEGHITEEEMMRGFQEQIEVLASLFKGNTSTACN